MSQVTVPKAQRLTINRYTTLVTDYEEIAARRQLEQLSPRWDRFENEELRLPFKNFAGTQAIWMMMPAYNKVTEAYWVDQDVRAALLARVRVP